MRPLPAIISITLSVIAAFALLIFMGLRSDGEIIGIADQSGNAVFEFQQSSKLSVFVCLPEELKSDLPEQLLITSSQASEQLEMMPPRPLTFPSQFAETYHVQQQVSCIAPLDTVLEIEGPDSVSVSAPPNSIVIAAVSKLEYTALSKALFFVFLLSLIYGIAGLSRRPHKNIIPAVQRDGLFIAAPAMDADTWLPLKRYDGVLAFVLAMVLSFGIAECIDKVIPPAQTLLPGYMEFTAMLCSNFFAFFAIYIVFAKFRSRSLPALVAEKFPAFENPVTIVDSPTPDAESPLKTSLRIPIFMPWISIVTAVGLAITAALLTLAAPTPGITTIEMASHLHSTLILSAIFAVFAGVSEELLFRGLIQGSLEAQPDSRHPNIENAIAITVATALFVLVHVPQSIEHLWALIPIGTVSIISGCLKIHYRSIFPSILLHMTYNATLLMPSIII
jgi:membrane protease YdiL (CAAX protease family)